MTTSTALNRCSILLVLALSACASTEEPAEPTEPSAGPAAQASGVFGAPEKPGAKADAATIAVDDACSQELMGMARNAEELEGFEGLADMMGGCRAKSLVELAASGAEPSKIDAAYLAIATANAVAEEIQFHDRITIHLPTWKQVSEDETPDVFLSKSRRGPSEAQIERLASAEATEIVEACGFRDVDEYGACIDENGSLRMGAMANPLRYRVNLELDAALAEVNSDEAWSASVGEFMERKERNNLIVLGVAAVAVGLTGYASYQVAGTGFALFLDYWGAPALAVAGVGVGGGYKSVSWGLGLISRARMAVLRELPQDDYVTCRCVFGEATAYHTDNIGWWAEWRNYSNERLAASCFEEAVETLDRSLDAGQAQCDVAFLK